MQHETSPTPMLQRNCDFCFAVVPRCLRQPRQTGADHHPRDNSNPDRNGNTYPRHYADSYPNRFPDRHPDPDKHPATKPNTDA